MQHKLLHGLNSEQEKAVTMPACHVLVLAGAGSGKTKVLTTRMAWLIETNQANKSEIFVVTFTNKAAKELFERLSKQLNLKDKSLWIGTFHGLCNRILRIHHEVASLPISFQILDSSDQLSLIKKLFKSLQIDEIKFSAKDAQKFINEQKENGYRYKDLEFIKNNRYKLLSDIYSAYEALCQKEGLVDFPELLLRCYELIRDNDQIRESYRNKFKHILIDEFQDTNKLQYNFIQLLLNNNNCIFAVGDDDQSIYAFRGAYVGNMIDFERNFAKKSIIRLEQNYRSLGHILKAANSLIEHNSNRLGKKLWTDKNNGEKISVVEKNTDILESQWISSEISFLVDKGIKLDDIAILYRSNAQSRAIEHALFLSNIPYRVYGGLRFFERQEIKHVLAYLRLIANKHDNAAWMRVVNFPPRGIGSKTLEMQTLISLEKDISLYDSIKYISGNPKNNLNYFVNIIDKLIYDSQILNLVDLLERILIYSGLNDYYKRLSDGKDRLENISELITAAKTFSIEENCENLPAGYNLFINEDNNILDNDLKNPILLFLAYSSLESGETNDNAGSVQMMTVHSAKGLEFDVVFITGLEEGLFPHENSIYEANGLAEERRLMYVAITRARKKLYITHTKNRMLHGQIRHFKKSRFISEIANENLSFMTLNNEREVGYINHINHSYDDSIDKKFYIGQRVNHSKFGYGIIIKLSGKYENQQATIRFNSVGIKEILLSIANIKPIL